MSESLVDTNSSVYQNAYADARSHLRTEIERRTQSQRKFDRRAGRAKKRLQPTVSYIAKCRGCGEHLDKPCPSRSHKSYDHLQQRYRIDRRVPCKACGNDPWESSAASSAATYTRDAFFEPYYEMGFDPRQLPDETYDPERGMLVRNRTHLEEMCKKTGMHIVEEYR